MAIQKLQPKRMKNKGGTPEAAQDNSVSMVDKAIRQAEMQIAKGKRTGQGIGNVRKPAGIGLKK